MFLYLDVQKLIIFIEEGDSIVARQLNFLFLFFFLL